MQTAIMDSSPQPAPPARRPLKRSASTASLPTPPYSREKRKRRASHHDSDSDEDDPNQLLDDADDDDNVSEPTEEDRLLTAKAERLGLLASSKTRPSAPPREPAVKKRARLDDDASQATKDIKAEPEQPAAAPLSPPRSRRQTTAPKIAAVIPRTPPPRRAKKATSKPVPVRGSPDNPFVDDGPRGGGSKDTRPPPRRASEEYEEKPTVTYVFRGVKATFDNPLYNQSPSARVKASLPIEDPEFSPDPAVPPRRLFMAQDLSDDDEETVDVKPKRLFAASTKAR
ncbi:hypothetical protein EXIGLDRAFT_762449 [Exidia glandulosa HHB12029]|uniref:Uncharacterized protein n=1 Tax=Exidia glandulosa HHB12029 TaxID=1314781 RepID=A0A165MPK4_EXIGL|nr:hypothetical protein EXIGLDRAFT_762449 [Exidia glandulosa HHB12029]